MCCSCAQPSASMAFTPLLVSTGFIHKPVKFGEKGDESRRQQFGAKERIHPPGE